MASFLPLPTGSPAHDPACVGRSPTFGEAEAMPWEGDKQGAEGCPTRQIAEGVSWEQPEV